MLVRIQAKRETSEDYKEWVVPHKLIIAQGYYEGQSQIWLPKALEKFPTTKTHMPKEGPREEGQSQVLKEKKITVPLSREPATWLTKEQKGKWVLKTQPTEQVSSAQDIKENQQQKEDQLKRPPRKTTGQDKEKWKLKASSTSDDGLTKQSPTTSIQAEILDNEPKSQTQPHDGTNPMATANQFVSFLKAFSPSQVEQQWKGFMTTQADNVASTSKALRSYLF